jgi:hypothetical protein
MKKLEPAVMNLLIPTGSIPAATFDPISGDKIANGTLTQFVDYSQIASLVNRRFYRQGIDWAIGGIKVLSQSNMLGSIVASTMPTTWVAYQAYRKAFEAWNRQQMEAVEAAGAESAVARFRDFKVFLDEDHYAATYAANLLPSDSAGNFPALGEWEASSIILPNADIDAVSGARTEPRACFMHIVGTNETVVAGVSSRGIIEGYADSRAYPQSPDPVSPAIDSGNNWLRAMFDVGNDNEDITDNATDKNDELPYDQVNYPGGQTNMSATQVMDIAYLSGTTVGGITRMKGGVVPAGLMRFDLSNETATSQNVILQIDLVPGTHRGYMCQKTLEV